MIPAVETDSFGMGRLRTRETISPVVGNSALARTSRKRYIRER